MDEMASTVLTLGHLERPSVPQAFPQHQLTDFRKSTVKNLFLQVTSNKERTLFSGMFAAASETRIKFPSWRNGQGL